MPTTLSSTNISGLQLKAGTVPTTPSAGYGRVWFRATNKTLHVVDDAGVDVDLSPASVNLTLSGQLRSATAVIGATTGVGSVLPLEITASDAGIAITSTSTAAGREAYVAGFLKNDSGAYFKAGADAFQVTDGNATDGYASWNIHTTAYTAGVTGDHVALAVWAKHGAAFFPANLAAGSAPGVDVLKINGGFDVTGAITGTAATFTGAITGTAATFTSQIHLTHATTDAFIDFYAGATRAAIIGNLAALTGVNGAAVWAGPGLNVAILPNSILGATFSSTGLVLVGSLTTNGGLQTFGANDSAGAGYRLVRVPNA